MAIFICNFPVNYMFVSTSSYINVDGTLAKTVEKKSHFLGRRGKTCPQPQAHSLYLLFIFFLLQELNCSLAGDLSSETVSRASGTSGHGGHRLSLKAPGIIRILLLPRANSQSEGRAGGRGQDLATNVASHLCCGL